MAGGTAMGCRWPLKPCARSMRYSSPNALSIARPRLSGLPYGSGTVRRQHLWDQTGDLNNGGFLAHPNSTESKDESSCSILML